jgi:hypothetical protein
MSPQVQSYLALIVVAMAVAGLVWRYRRKRQKPGCGGECGCAASDLKPKFRAK